MGSSIPKSGDDTQISAPEQTTLLKKVNQEAKEINNS